MLDHRIARILEKSIAESESEENWKREETCLQVPTRTPGSGREGVDNGERKRTEEIEGKKPYIGNFLRSRSQAHVERLWRHLCYEGNE